MIIKEKESMSLMNNPGDTGVTSENPFKKLMEGQKHVKQPDNNRASGP
jgi:hypothetical protein